MARKLPGLRRELDARSLYSVAYGEIASSIYFALGVIALHAVGFTPLVLLGAGLLFLLVALSYAEATSALPETGGAATFVRRTSSGSSCFWRWPYSPRNELPTGGLCRLEWSSSCGSHLALPRCSSRVCA